MTKREGVLASHPSVEFINNIIDGMGSQTEFRNHPIYIQKYPPDDEGVVHVMISVGAFHWDFCHSTNGKVSDSFTKFIQEVEKEGEKKKIQWNLIKCYLDLIFHMNRQNRE